MIKQFRSKLSTIQFGHLLEVFENKNVILSGKQP